MKICERCMRLIKADEEYESHDKLSISAAGTTVHVHKVCPLPEIPGRPAASRIQRRTRDI